MRITADVVRPSDLVRMANETGKVVAVGGSDVLTDGVRVTLAHIDDPRSQVVLHLAPSTPLDVLRREGKGWTEDERQWAFDNDVAATRPGGDA